VADHHPMKSISSGAGAGSSIDRVRCIQQDVKDRLIAYWRDVDRHDASGALDYYTSDCTYQMIEHRMEGREAVQRYYEYRASRGKRLVRHVISNQYVEVRSEKSVFQECTLCVYAADGEPVLTSAPPIMVADAECHFIREDDGIWRMKEHRLIALFTGGVKVLVPPTV
jgi:hypothetical protein